MMLGSVLQRDLELSSHSMRPAAIGQLNTHTVTIKNSGPNDVPEGLMLRLVRNGYFRLSTVKVGPIPAYSEISVLLPVKMRTGVTIEDITNSKRIELVDVSKPERPVVASRGFTNGCMWFFKPTLTQMADELGDTGCNILVFGIAGAGKSSFIQTCMNIVVYGSELKVGEVRIGGGTGHVTKDLRCHTIEGKIKLWDTWGLTGTNYKTAELRRMLNGSLPDGWGMCEHLGDRTEEIRLDMPNRRFRKPHAVMVFIPHGSIENEDEMKALKTQLAFMEDAGLNPIIVLALVDQLHPGLRRNAMQPPKQLEDQMAHVSRLFNVPRYRVTYAVNYESETRRDFDIERLCYKNLMMALREAKGVHAAREAQQASSKQAGTTAPACITDTPPAAAPSNPLAASAPGGPLCVVCDDGRADNLVQPCGHLCMCQACAPRVLRDRSGCPMCREEIDTVQRIFY